MLLGGQKACEVCDGGGGAGGGGDRVDNRSRAPRRRSTGSNSGQWVGVPLIVYWAHSLNWAKAALYIFRIWGLLLRKWMWRRRWPRIGLLLPNCIIFDQVQGEVLWIKQWLVPFRSRRSKRSFSWTSGPHLSNQTGSGTWDGCGALPSGSLIYCLPGSLICISSCLEKGVDTFVSLECDLPNHVICRMLRF